MKTNKTYILNIEQLLHFQLDKYAKGERMTAVSMRSITSHLWQTHVICTRCYSQHF